MKSISNVNSLSNSQSETAMKSNPKSSQPLIAPTAIAIVCFVVGAICLAPTLSNLWQLSEKTAVASSNTDESLSPFAPNNYLLRPIEEIRPGNRVLADNPELAEETKNRHFRIDSSSWCLIELLLKGHESHEVEICLLRPNSWLQEHQAVVGSKLDLKLDELGIEGQAGVLRISSCPEIQAGSGHVVTGTFKHTSDDIVDVKLSNGEILSCTSDHPFWSVRLGCFIEIGALNRGDELLSADGTKTKITSIKYRSQTAEVFNLEVAIEHVYFVGSSGVLVHNNSNCIKPSGEENTGKEPRGDVERPHENDGPGKVRALALQEQAAQTLAQKGYDVERVAEVNGQRSADLLLEGKEFDVFSPEYRTGVDSILKTIKGKAEGPNVQTNHGIVLNLDGTRTRFETIKMEMAKRRHEFPNLVEILVVQNGNVRRLFP